MPSRATFFRLLAVIATGLMTAFLFPPYNFSTLAWICLIPLLIAIWSLHGAHSARKGFLLGYLAGLISFGLTLSWLTTVTWVGAIALICYLAIYWGLFGAFAATLGKPWSSGSETTVPPLRSLVNALILGSIWAGLELLRGIFPILGFSWNGLGTAFHDTLVISQAADILGVAGLSLVLVFFQCVLVQVGHRIGRTGSDGLRRPRWDFAVAALSIAVLLAYGILRISSESGKESIPLKALLVQINIPQDASRVLWTAEEVHMAYEDETLGALGKIAENDETKLKDALDKSGEGTIALDSPDWVVWPETALTGRIIRAENGQWGTWRENMETIRRIREAGTFDLIYGAVEIEGEVRDDLVLQKEHPRIYNSIAIQTAADDLLTFRKHHLVAFGETIPFVDSIPFLKKIYEQQSGAQYSGSFSIGPSLDPLPLDLNGREIQIIPSVCFEDTVPGLTRKFIRDAPQIIVNLTNDGWFGKSPAAAQHFANARFRSIELRRPMIRCANTGVSAAIDTLGSTVSPETGLPQVIMDAKGSTFVRGSLPARVKIPVHPSFSLYALIGNWGIAVLTACGLCASFLLRKNCSKFTRQEARS